jgi:uncharacterized protein
MAESSTVSGWAVQYNQPTVISGSFIERIAPGAFKGSLDDVVLLWGHDRNQPLARTTSGTLQLRDEGRMGLWFSADLDPANPDAAKALSSIGRRDTSKMSFGFSILKEEWVEPVRYDDLPERIVLEAIIYEISAVVWPAYEQSAVDIVRADHDRENGRRRIAVKAAEAKMRARGII